MTMTDDERKTAEEYADELRERVGDRYFKDSKVQMLLGEAVRNYSEAGDLRAEVVRLRKVAAELLAEHERAERIIIDEFESTGYAAAVAELREKLDEFRKRLGLEGDSE